MNRFALRFSVALLAFLIGIAVNSAWSAFSISTTAPSQSSIEKQLIFKPLSRYYYYKSWTQDYESSDGEMVFVLSRSYESPAEANKHLNLYVGYAERVLERTRKLDVNGEQIGERVVTIFPENDLGSVWIRIVWTDGSQLNSVSAFSLRHALEFEGREIYRRE